MVLLSQASSRSIDRAYIGLARGEAVLASMVCLSTPDAELIEVLKQPVEIRNPQNQNEDNHAVQNRFDLPLHGDESVHKPQQKPCCDNRDEYGGKWHIVFSNRFSGSVPRASSRSYKLSTRLAWEPPERGERLLRFILILPSQWRNS
jgi:hypothetical protein